VLTRCVFSRSKTLKRLLFVALVVVVVGGGGDEREEGRRVGRAFNNENKPLLSSPTQKDENLKRRISLVRRGRSH
jgi:hypothetical protein